MEDNSVGEEIRIKENDSIGKNCNKDKNHRSNKPLERQFTHQQTFEPAFLHDDLSIDLQRRQSDAGNSPATLIKES